MTQGIIKHQNATEVQVIHKDGKQSLSAMFKASPQLRWEQSLDVPMTRNPPKSYSISILY